MTIYICVCMCPLNILLKFIFFLGFVYSLLPATPLQDNIPEKGKVNKNQAARNAKSLLKVHE